jgi:hypothetical protein
MACNYSTESCALTGLACGFVQPLRNNRHRKPYNGTVSTQSLNDLFLADDERLNRASDRFFGPDARVTFELAFVSGVRAAPAMSIHEPRRPR